jgi:hypothetical protein
VLCNVMHIGRNLDAEKTHHTYVFFMGGMNMVHQAHTRKLHKKQGSIEAAARRSMGLLSIHTTGKKTTKKNLD